MYALIYYYGLQQALLKNCHADLLLDWEELVQAQPDKPPHGLDDPLVLLRRGSRPQVDTPPQDADDLVLVRDRGHVLQQLQHRLPLCRHLFRCQHRLQELGSNFGIRIGHDELLVRVGDRLVAHSQVVVVAWPHHDGAGCVLVDALVLGQPRSEAVALENGRVDLLQDSKGGFQ